MRHNLFQMGQQVVPIGQAGLRVMQTLVAQLLLQQLQFGDVIHGRHQVQGLRGARQSCGVED